MIKRARKCIFPLIWREQYRRSARTRPLVTASDGPTVAVSSLIPRLTGGGSCKASFLDPYVEQQQERLRAPENSHHQLRPLIIFGGFISEYRSTRPMTACCPHYIRTMRNLSYLNKAFVAIVQLRNAAATRACRGGRIPGDPKPSCPLLHLAWPLKKAGVHMLSACHERANKTVTLLSFTWRTVDQYTNAIDL